MILFRLIFTGFPGKFPEDVERLFEDWLVFAIMLVAFSITSESNGRTAVHVNGPGTLVIQSS